MAKARRPLAPAQPPSPAYKRIACLYNVPTRCRRRTHVHSGHIAQLLRLDLVDHRKHRQVHPADHGVDRIVGLHHLPGRCDSATPPDPTTCRRLPLPATRPRSFVPHTLAGQKGLHRCVRVVAIRREVVAEQ